MCSCIGYRWALPEQPSTNMALWKLLMLQVFLLLQRLAEHGQNNKEYNNKHIIIGEFYTSS